MMNQAAAGRVLELAEFAGHWVCVVHIWCLYVVGCDGADPH